MRLYSKLQINCSKLTAFPETFLEIKINSPDNVPRFELSNRQVLCIMIFFLLKQQGKILLKKVTEMFFSRIQKTTQLYLKDNLQVFP